MSAAAPETTDRIPSTPLGSGSAQEAYATRFAAGQVRLAALDRRSALYANARAVTFLAAVGVLAARLLHRLSTPVTTWTFLGALFLYAALAFFHNRVFQEEGRARMAKALNERGLSRLAGTWRSFPEDGAGRGAGSLNAGDLDLFGHGSLFQLLNETVTRAGEQKLAALLLASEAQPSLPEAIRARQVSLQELAPKLDFRQALIIEGRSSGGAKASPEGLIHWAENAPSLESVRWARLLPFLLPPLLLVTFVLGRLELLPPWTTWPCLFALLAVVALTNRALAAYFNALSAGEGGLARLEATFAQVERARFEAPLLCALAAGLSPEGQRVSARLSSLSRIYGWAELRRSQLHGAVNLLTLWDLLFLFRLERWRKAHGHHVRGWFQALAELEALCALAGFAFDRPTFTFPEVSEGAVKVEATQLSHPLLDRPVANDVSLDGPGHALILTGSNMSGKTTLLRAVGVNLVLAQAGAPVAAALLTFTPLRVLTSMRLSDSLERGVSYFYAEVQRLKALLEVTVDAGGRALLLLDEILMGTNTRERQWASREMLRLFLDRGALLAIATHDLTLATLEAESGGKIRNAHFVDGVEDGKMTFDYRLRPGVVTGTNALKVLQGAGIPVRDAGGRE